jgi:hypothetical protein
MIRYFEEIGCTFVFSANVCPFVFTNILYIPFAVITILGFYLSWEYSEQWTWLIIFGVLSLALIYIFSSEINWWYYRRHPPDVDAPVRHMLETTDLFYQDLSPAERTRFRQRLALFLMNNQFMPQGWESVPHDIEAIIGIAATKVLLHQAHPLFRTCNRIVVYPAIFPSPAYPLDWHGSEYFAEDEVLLFAMEQILPGFSQPTQYPDLTLYEYVRVMRIEVPELPWDQVPAEPWKMIEAVSGFSEEGFRQYLGLPDADGAALFCTLYFTHPHRLMKVDPQWMEMLEALFGPNPWKCRHMQYTAHKAPLSTPGA